MEIEKKFLCSDFDLSGYKFKNIEQSYISTFPTIRIRKMDDEYILTIKGKGHLEREEHELNITKDEYENLLLKIEHNTIKKKRYYIALDNYLTAELDVYFDNLLGLKTVEVEFKTVFDANNFTPPSWFLDDVTYDKKYKNSNLAKINKGDELF